jgi:hypothetical protein
MGGCGFSPEVSPQWRQPNAELVAMTWRMAAITHSAAPTGRAYQRVAARWQPTAQRPIMRHI